MAFVTAASSFLGTRVPTQGAICRRARLQATVVSPRSPDTASSGDSDDPNVMPVPRYAVKPLKKGQSFNFVRFFKDDFEPSPYFEGLTGAGVRVAVLDTGIDRDHPALKGRIDFQASRNYISRNPDDWNDTNGHGTHCAGIIAAEKGRAPMYGVAPEATIVAKKVIPGGQASLAQAIRDAVNEDCRVISMSLGWPYQRGVLAQEFDQVYRACMEALAKGVVVVAAAGNYGRNRFGVTDRTNTISPPAVYGGLITVASHDDAGNKSTFSSYGGELDFMAPGEVVSTWPIGLPKAVDQPNIRGVEGYSALSGTSMACPLVSGLSALLIEAGNRAQRGNFSGMSPQLVRDVQNSRFGARNCYEVREMLRGLSENPNEHNRQSGYGRLVGAYQYVMGTVEEDI